MILICYDGSDDARAAIAEAGKLLAGQPAVILTVWEPLTDLLTRTPAGLGLMSGIAEPGDVDDASRSAAERAAAEGADLARAAGLDASPRVRPQDGPIADSILAEADAADASVIVMGSRGRTGLGSLLLGSVSHAVVQHADRGVLVIPSPGVARTRHQRRHASERA